MQASDSAKNRTAEGPEKILLMEVCGTHTMAIAKAGIKAILPPDVELVSSKIVTKSILVHS